MSTGISGALKEETTFGDTKVELTSQNRWFGRIDRGNGRVESLMIYKTSSSDQLALDQQESIMLDKRAVLIRMEIRDKRIDKKGEPVRSLGYVLTKDAETGKWRTEYLSHFDYKAFDELIRVREVEKRFESFIEIPRVKEWLDKDDWFTSLDESRHSGDAGKRFKPFREK